MSGSYQPGESIADQLGGYVSNLDSDFLDYWGLQNEATTDRSDSSRELLRKLEGLGSCFRAVIHSLDVDRDAAEALRRVLREVMPDHPGDDDSLIPFVSLVVEHPAVMDRLKIDLAFEGVDMLLATAEQRLEPLLSLVAYRTLSERAAAFLDRATRLFLWGFEPECIVMCGAVLEAALEDRFTDEHMKRLDFNPSGSGYSAAAYIQAAKRTGVFDRRRVDLAHQLRSARNGTVHGAPAIAGSAQDALTDLVTLLDAVFPSDPSGV